MTLSTLTDTELNERIGKAMGWKQHCPDCPLWKSTDGHEFGSYLPEYVDSLDALKSGPEKMLREAGWEISVSEHAVTYIAMWWNKRDLTQIRGSAPTEERARAEAVCQGLEVSK